VFDAAQPVKDRPSEYDFQGISVRFAVDHDEADDLLEDLIRANSAPRRLAVISSDGRVQQAASRRGSTVYEAQVWLDELLDGVVGLADGVRIEAGKGRGDHAAAESDVEVSDEEARNWLREFGFE
jgi:predicted RNA-binding protein with PIN domain